jgi:diadenosine tetraphosphatase ApaH/serine/threonine PP2A family protein phosphatase
LKVGVLSDIHANWPALEAVLEHARDVDEIVCLGDVVGYGGDPARCLDEVRARGWTTLVGNHDRACTDPTILEWFNPDAASVIRWTKEQLGEERLEWLGHLPETHERGAALLVHASPRDPIYEYILDGLTAHANLEMLGDGVCFHGHSHVPGLFYLQDGQVAHNYWHGRARLAGPMLVNPGSVGQPRDGDPDASYGVWDAEAGSFEFRRVKYDRKKAQRSILAAGLPERFASRLDLGR